jgi:phenylacetate-CoA ligase
MLRLYKPGLEQTYNAMLKLERRTRLDVLEIQERTVRRLLRHAYETCPYYREVLDARGLGPRVTREECALDEIPVLTKDILRRRADDLLSRGADRRRVIESRTSGSTGSPVRFFLDARTVEMMRAASRRTYTWCGWRPGDRVLHLWGASSDLSGPARLKRTVAEWMYSERHLDASRFDEAALEAWRSTLLAYRPAILQGYPSVLTSFARFLRDRSGGLPRLKGVYTTAEVLHPWQREVLETVFGCKVYNQYGSREVHSMACECPAGSLHVLTDMARVEVAHLDGAAEGQRKLIVTSLSNWTMPLLRYEIGDTGKLSETACGCRLPFPTMEMGVCREYDLIVAPDGRRVHPSLLNRFVLEGARELTSYQYHQTSRTELRLHVLRAEASPEVLGKLEAIGARVRREIHPDLHLAIVVVPEIPRQAGGKHRFVISDIKDPGSSREA